MAAETTVGDVTIELVEGDITAQPDLGAVVNAANAELMPGGGVAGAIHRAAGPGLAEECRPLAPIRPGECVITSGHGMPNGSVIHCLGPVFGVDEPAEELLASCYRRALELADEAGLDSVGFPAISSGAFGYPMGEAAEVALRTVIGAAPGLERVRRVRFVLFGSAALDAHAAALERLAGEAG
jgi:O-acetyl-ADP-ribose deacetylase (regulator of RNase III)